MTARAISSVLTPEQRMAMDKTSLISSHFQMKVGKVYLVLGIASVVGSSIHGNGPLFEICDDAGRCVSTPAALFEIVDPRPSRFWQAERAGIADLYLWPKEFYTRFFHDDLSEGVPEVVALFEDVIARLSSEFSTE